MNNIDWRYRRYIIDHQRKLSAVLKELREYMPEYLATKHNCILYPEDSVVVVKYKIIYNNGDEDRSTFEYSPADGQFWNEMIEDLEELRGCWFECWRTVD